MGKRNKQDKKAPNETHNKRNKEEQNDQNKIRYGTKKMGLEKKFDKTTHEKATWDEPMKSKLISKGINYKTG